MFFDPFHKLNASVVSRRLSTTTTQAKERRLGEVQGEEEEEQLSRTHRAAPNSHAVASMSSSKNDGYAAQLARRKRVSSPALALPRGNIANSRGGVQFEPTSAISGGNDVFVNPETEDSRNGYASDEHDFDALRGNRRPQYDDGKSSFLRIDDSLKSYLPPRPLPHSPPPLHVLTPDVARLVDTVREVSLSKIKGDDLAVLVYEGRLRLQRVRKERRENEAKLKEAKLRVEALRKSESDAHSQYIAACGAFDEFMFEASESSESVDELEKFEGLIMRRLKQDELTITNLRNALVDMEATLSDKLLEFRSTQQELVQARDYYSRLNAEDVREGQRLREEVRALEAEARIVLARVHDRLKAYKQDAE